MLIGSIITNINSLSHFTMITKLVNRTSRETQTNPVTDWLYIMFKVVLSTWCTIQMLEVTFATMPQNHTMSPTYNPISSYNTTLTNSRDSTYLNTSNTSAPLSTRTQSTTTTYNSTNFTTILSTHMYTTVFRPRPSPTPNPTLSPTPATPTNEPTAVRYNFYSQVFNRLFHCENRV